MSTPSPKYAAGEASHQSGEVVSTRVVLEKAMRGFSPVSQYAFCAGVPEEGFG